MTTSYTKKKNGQKYFYYKCSRQHHFESGICPEKQVEAKRLEKSVLSFLFELSQDKNLIDATVKTVYHGQNEEIRKLKD